MTSFSVNSNTERTNVIMGRKTRTIRGKDRIEDTIGGLVFTISPQSFYQVNPVQTENIYSQALSYAGLTGNETVWDLYCGIGTISLFLARQAKQVYGVEIVPQAIDDARQNAVRNGIDNAKFYVGKAGGGAAALIRKQNFCCCCCGSSSPSQGVAVKNIYKIYTQIERF